MRPSQALAPIGPRLALLAMIVAVALSARVGVENLFCMVRGIVAFVGTLWLFRFGAGILDFLAPAPPAQQPEPAQAPPEAEPQGAAEPST